MKWKLHGETGSRPHQNQTQTTKKISGRVHSDGLSVLREIADVPVHEDHPPDANSVDALLAEARRGSTEALGRVLENCRPYLLVVARHVLPSQLQAKVDSSDVVQDTLLKAQQEFRRFEGSQEKQWLAWLRAILLNGVANVTRHFATDMRQVAREVPLDAADSEAMELGVVAPGPSPSGAALARERDEALNSAVDQLPEHYRQVIVLRNRDGLEFEEIGQQTGQSPDAARKTWLRALRRLRQFLEESHGPE